MRSLPIGWRGRRRPPNLEAMNVPTLRFLRAAAAGVAILACSAAAQAQAPGGTRLAIIITRHGVRTPIGNFNQAMEKFATQPWPQWEVPPGELTPHGRELMRLMGAYYRELYAREGLLSGRAEEDQARVFLRADNDQRTIETARDLAAGLLPGWKADVRARPSGVRDPLFRPLLAGLGHPDPALAAAAVLGRIGNDPSFLLTAHARTFATMESILLGGQGRLPPGKAAITAQPERIEPDPAALSLASFTGPMRIAARSADTFILEYADGKPLSEVGWGRVDKQTLCELMQLHSLYFDLTQSSFYPAQLQGSNLAKHIGLTLEQAATGRAVAGAIGPPGERVVVLVGHDTNLANLAGILGLSWWLDGTQRNPVLPGGALVLELRDRPGGGFLLRVFYVCQTLDQMRSCEPLTLAHPPSIAPIFIPQCSGGAPGYDAPLERFQAQLGRLIDPGFTSPGSD